MSDNIVTPGAEPERSDELVISVYLDTLVLLDLLATAEDGFAMVERVSSTLGAAATSEREASGQFGVPKVLNLFKLGFSGKLGRRSTNESRQERDSELTHTYGSLLHRLRVFLLEEQLVHRLDNDSANGADLPIGSFLEFSGIVRANPFTDSFRRIQRMLKFVDSALTYDAPNARPPNPRAQRQGQGQGQQRRTQSPEAAQLKAISDFLEQITTDVEREGTRTAVLEDRHSGYTAVVTLFTEYLRDRSMAELLNREFRVLGKVARHLPPGSTEGVDLIASSGISGFPPEMLTQLGAAVAEMSSGQELASPTTSIGAPVVEIVPIAIYL